jgi:hypothetical protein
VHSRNIVLGLGLLSLVAAVGCGSSGNIPLPNPSGNFSNASLQGSYVFEMHGFDATSGNPYREVGVFSADGNGNITGGIDDSSFSAVGTAITGSYSIGKDGTGFVGFNTSSVGQVVLAITMTSSSQAYLLEADYFANAAGTAELQDSTAIGTTPSGPFVYRLHQELSAENSSFSSSEVGEVTVSNGSGSGSMDQNLAGVYNSPNVSWTVNAPGSNGRGTGNFVNASTNFTTNFVYYIVDSTQIQLMVSNIGAVGSGSAEIQTGNVSAGLSGSYAFGSRGDDSNFYAGIATVGQFSAASGSIAGVQDLSQDGSISLNVMPSSCYTAAANGRVAVNILSGNTCTTTLSQVFWMVNPSRAFFLNVNPSTAEDGTADLQTSANFTAANFNGQFGLVMDGVDITPELLSRIGTLQFDGSSKLALNELANASASGAGAQSPGLITGTYTTAANGRATGSLNSGSLNFVMYAVSGSQFYVLQTDTGYVTSGTLQLQP